MNRTRISVLGAGAAALAFAAGLGVARAGGPVAAGRWGGPHVSLEVTDSGGRIEFDCAHGTLEEPLQLDADGRFDVRGTFSREHGGPIRRGEEESGKPARYAGSIRGTTMELSVTLTEGNQAVGSFTLESGKAGLIHKCL